MKKKFTFVIDIPDWLYRFRWDNIKSYVNYHINKPTCLTCNTKVTFRHFNIWVNTPHYPQLRVLDILNDFYSTLYESPYPYFKAKSEIGYLSFTFKDDISELTHPLGG